VQIFVTCAQVVGSTWIEDMGREESSQLIEKTQVDTNAQETRRALNFWINYPLVLPIPQRQNINAKLCFRRCQTGQKYAKLFS